MKIVIAAGGTGGHIYPGVAIAEELVARDPKNEILFIGSREGLEGDLVRKEGFNIKLISARALLRKISYKALSAPFVSLLGFFQSLALLSDFRPRLVVVTGGYVSFPVIAAARTLRIPVLLHEQNVLPGITCRFWSRFVDLVTISFEDTQRYMKGTVTGNPVRKRILNLKKQRADRSTVLVLGGSQGARSINLAVVKQLANLKDYNVIHVIGERDFDLILHKLDLLRFPFYHPHAYLYNIDQVLAVADLIVSRAGATAISEMLALGVPSVLIPFPYSSEGHQDKNAEAVEKAGAGLVLKDKNLDELSGMILKLLSEPERLSKMGQAAKKLARMDAAQKIVDLIYAIN